MSAAFNSPIVVKDYRAFFSLAQMFKAQIFVIYCNPNDPDTEDKVLKAAIKAKRDFPTVLKLDED